MAEATNELELRKTGAVERFLESPYRRAIICSVFAGAICLFLACCINTGNTDDDWTLSLYLSGRIVGQGLSLHVNALFSQIIFFLNTWIPSISWFFAAEHFTAFLALAAFTYSVLTWWRCGSGCAVLALVIVYIMPSCIAASNYTVVAFLATAAGGALLIRRMQDHSSGAPTAIVGVVLVLLGLALRLQMFALGAPFLFVAFIQALLARNDKSAGGFDIKKLAPIIVSLALCLFMLVYDHIVWQQDGWKDWREYNEPRTAISDYPMPSYAEASNQLAELGISENDYFMLINWASADVDTLDTETISDVAELKIEPDLTPLGIAESLLQYIRSIAERPIFFGLIFIAAIMLAAESKRSRATVCLEFCIALVVCLYFLAAGRLPDRVEEPAWLYACMAALTCVVPQGTEKHLRVSRTPQRVLLTLGGIMLFAGTGYMIHQNLPFLSISGYATSLSQADIPASGVISSYVETHPDCAYVTDTSTYTRFELEYGYRYLPRTDTATRLLPLGGWGSGSPFRRAQSELLEATNPFEALLTSNKTYLITTPGMADRVLAFLREHYDSGATMTQIDTVIPDGTDTPVWDFEPSDNLVSNHH